MLDDSKKAVVLVSGGLDSATCLAIARDEGYSSYALSFDYGQRHLSEINASEALCAEFGVIEHKIVRVDLAGIGGSSLTDQKIDVLTADPNLKDSNAEKNSVIPNTYVPARNTLFLSVALGWAEVLAADSIFIGVNAVDYSGYPDCRPEFIEAFASLSNLATKAGIEGNGPRLEAPLISLNKAEIIQKGVQLGLDYGLTVSCYQATDLGEACGCCESCQFRKEGFIVAGIPDPTRYR